MTVINIQKLPSLEPQMRSALRSHIMKKRQRLKQELEQDAIMERMKKEREQKRIQDAMTLDQIKDQLSKLEKKLEALCDEKHNLFVQLKQVLNEGSSKRKEIDSNPTPSSSSPSTVEEKRPKLEKIPVDQNQSIEGNTMQSQPCNTSPTPSSSNHRNLNTAIKSTHKTLEGAPSKDNRELKSAQLRHIPQPTAQQAPFLPSISSAPKTSSDNYEPGLSHFSIPGDQYSNLMLRLPSLHPNHDSPSMVNDHSRPNLINLSRHEQHLPTSSTINPQNLANLQVNLRSSLGSSDGLSHEYIMGNRLDQNYRRFSSPIGAHELPVNPAHFDTTNGLAQNFRYQNQHQQRKDIKVLSSYNASKTNMELINKASRAIRFDDPSLDFKKGPTGITSFHPNQFLIDGSMPIPIAHLNLTNQTTLAGNNDHSPSIAQSLIPLSHNDINPQYQYHPLRSSSTQNTIRPSVDFLPGQVRPNVLAPGLNLRYPSQQSPSFMPPTSIYGPRVEMDLKQLNAFYRPVMSQQFTVNPIPHFSNTLAQQQQQERQKEQSSKMFTR
uniref:G protein pathway suppressor 2 n=1 Tax=Aceria tosichella TaxID=561515 RepID=A0A6G1SK72_9ACAR